ncbi:PTS mannitol transporter subunit IICB [Periweissella fabalis]|uniref:PTS system mannitol-specific EIICB component n=1 Tax=Periweissella fabalis TaxID=1070421 RepID=A0A7X6S2M0_9LACO|nr:PTS mannitol transporter subunit IICB [Periweissella fabalis]MCM0599394.1 PTS mannitol transporter subunit IICB [Periweissella fabalis]NKZ23673.1 PTS mannitol transporter subunit IICB [Periweissella fabalis]
MQVKQTTSLKVKIQRLGTALSSMVMPNIPALIAWGVLTAFFIPAGFLPNKGFAHLVGPMLAYLIPLMIAYTGGKNIYEHRGGIVGAIGAFGAIQIAQDTQGIPMILGAMIIGPLGAWLMKKFDEYVQPHIKAGFEMLVNNFSAGFVGFFLALISYKLIGPLVALLTQLMAKGVDFLIATHLIPLANVFIEPAKILFLNNAINQGILTPLGLEQAKTAGKSLLFLLEANPGPGLGILIAFMIFGKGSAKATAPGAILIQFIGGIHEIYFPYVMMKPALFFAVIAGGVSGTFTNNILGSGLVAPASPGSIISITGVAAPAGIQNILSVWAGVIVATAVSFLVAAIILKRDKSLVDDTQLVEAQAHMADAKAVAKGQNATKATTITDDMADIKHIIFACDAGMGSSAMGASILRDKVKKAGLGIEVTNRAISNLTDGADTLVVTQEELADRAATKAPSSVRVAVSNFLNSPKYDEIVNMLSQANNMTSSQTMGANTANTKQEIDCDVDLNVIDEVVFARDEDHIGSATMGKAVLQAIFDRSNVNIPISDVQFEALASYNAPNIMVVTTLDFADQVSKYAPRAQNVAVSSLITTTQYDKMIKRMHEK